MAKRSISLSLLKLELNIYMRDGTACSYFLIENKPRIVFIATEIQLSLYRQFISPRIA